VFFLSRVFFFFFFVNTSLFILTYINIFHYRKITTTKQNYRFRHRPAYGQPPPSNFGPHQLAFQITLRNEGYQTIALEYQ